jgi:antitoxin component of RelBE/YafQ-DinJ toxin-antitoxin module
MAALTLDIDDRLAADAAAVFGASGLGLPEAVTLFFRRAAEERRVPLADPDPFYSKENMAWLMRAMRDRERGVNFHEHELVDLPDEEAVAR